MQTLARVNRTFRGTPSGLLVAYAQLVENLNAALAEYTQADRESQPVGKDVSEAVALTETLVGRLDELCAGYDWRAMAANHQRGWMKAAVGLTERAGETMVVDQTAAGDVPIPAGQAA